MVTSIKESKKQYPGIDVEKIEGCSFFSTSVDKNWNNFLESKGSLVFAMNHRDTLSVYVFDDEYDESLKKITSEIDPIFGDFINEQNKTFNVTSISNVIVSGKIPESQCSNHRIYEFESFRYEQSIDDYEYAYGLKYSNGVPTDVGKDKLPSSVIDKISNVLRRVGVWE